MTMSIKQQFLIKISLFLTNNPTMNVYRVIFDSKLQWGPQVENAIKKSNRAKHAILLIKKYFNKSELNTLLTSNFTLYYTTIMIIG